jgi:preprotein translocase subunit SecG
MNKSIAKNFLSRSPFVRAILIAVTLLAIGLAQSAKANTITYTYTGNPFSYVGTGPDVT